MSHQTWKVGPSWAQVRNILGSCSSNLSEQPLFKKRHQLAILDRKCPPQPKLFPKRLFVATRQLLCGRIWVVPCHQIKSVRFTPSNYVGDWLLYNVSEWIGMSHCHGLHAIDDESSSKANRFKQTLFRFHSGSSHPGFTEIPLGSLGIPWDLPDFDDFNS